jgi:hypothetical protein
MDPISIVSTTSAVTKVLGLLFNTIYTLCSLKQQWTDADIALATLIAQLGTLRSALGKVQNWADGDLDDQHHQLVMDLDLSIDCCRMLITQIDGHISSLRTKADGSLLVSSKVKMLFGSDTLDRIQGMIDRQINALTFLLTACNWYGII